MADADPKEFLLDPLSEVARKERRNLLFASTFSIAVDMLGLVPTKLSALGIDFPPPAQDSFLILLALVVGYFIVAFVIYASADFFAWWKKRYDYSLAVLREMEAWSEDDQRQYDEIRHQLPKISWYYQWSPKLSIVRAFFEFGVPVLLGLYAIFSLFVHA